MPLNRLHEHVKRMDIQHSPELGKLATYDAGLDVSAVIYL